jgi:Spy/CpxP family protein refolding chaperone
MRVKPLVAVIALVLLVTLVVSAQDAAKPKPVRLVQPWSKLTTLSEDQKAKINEIHLKANAAKNEIDKKERTDIIALLSAEQQTELKKVEELDRATAKERSAAQVKEKQE